MITFLVWYVVGLCTILRFIPHRVLKKIRIRYIWIIHSKYHLFIAFLGNIINPGPKIILDTSVYVLIANTRHRPLFPLQCGSKIPLPFPDDWKCWKNLWIPQNPTNTQKTVQQEHTILHKMLPSGILRRCITKLFFTRQERTNNYVCRQGVKRKNPGRSYVNLGSHVISQRRYYESLLYSDNRIARVQLDRFFNTTKTGNYFGWFRLNH